jgi:hypothetical protein
MEEQHHNLSSADSDSKNPPALPPGDGIQRAADHPANTGEAPQMMMESPEVGATIKAEALGTVHKAQGLIGRTLIGSKSLPEELRRVGKSYKEFFKLSAISTAKSVRELARSLPTTAVKELVTLHPKKAVKEIAASHPVMAAKELVTLHPIRAVSELAASHPVAAVKEYVFGTTGNLGNIGSIVTSPARLATAGVSETLRAGKATVMAPIKVLKASPLFVWNKLNAGVDKLFRMGGRANKWAFGAA